TVLDGLAATGAWGIRMQLEAGPYEITFNDRSTLAVRLIRENLRRNWTRGDVVNGELVSLLGTDQYDFVDIDPFGPPTPFLGALFEEIKNGSGLGVTATDTSVLSGTYPAACLRRYLRPGGPFAFEPPTRGGPPGVLRDDGRTRGSGTWFSAEVGFVPRRTSGDRPSGGTNAFPSPGRAHGCAVRHRPVRLPRANA